MMGKMMGKNATEATGKLQDLWPAVGRLQTTPSTCNLGTDGTGLHNPVGLTLDRRSSSNRVHTRDS